MDNLSAEDRSILMRSVRQKDTTPELIVRCTAHRLGYRFRLHRKDLPGTPDIVFPKHKTCIFVHGCFWHRHEGCKKATTPKTRKRFWKKKFEENKNRDIRKISELEALGWNSTVIWECESKDPDVVRILLKVALRGVHLDPEN